MQPLIINEDISSDLSSKWDQNTIDELDSMSSDEVWELVKLPKSIKPIGCKWVHITKLYPKGNV